MLSDQQKKRIHAAMEGAGGSTAKAAELLGITAEDLHTIIHNNKDLKTRWTKSAKETPAPSGAVTLHRPTLPSAPGDAGGVVKSEKEIAEAIEKEDALVRTGLTALGLKGDSLDMAMALQKFHNKHFQRAIEMLGGGVTKQFLDLMAEVDAISKKLNNTTTAKLDINEELMLREDRSRLLDMMQKFYDRANQAVLTQAKVRMMQSQGNNSGDKNKPRKPGFQPLVAVHGEHVTVTQSQAPE